MMRYFYVATGMGLFAFDSGDYILDAELSRATSTPDPAEAQRMLGLARSRSQCATVMELKRLGLNQDHNPMYVLVPVSEEQFKREADDLLVRRARAKLTPEETAAFTRVLAREVQK